ncbi:MAG: hypothetical protein ABI054_12220, partial [Planctomycetota bacterium]
MSIRCRRTLAGIALAAFFAGTSLAQGVGTCGAALFPGARFDTDGGSGSGGPNSVDMADLNGDGSLDLALAV